MFFFRKELGFTFQQNLGMIAWALCLSTVWLHHLLQSSITAIPRGLHIALMIRPT